MNRTASLLACLGVLSAVLGARGEPAEFDWGFVASRQTDVNGDTRLKVLGPFFEQATSADGRQFLAVRPFYSAVAAPQRDRTLREVLWPVYTGRTDDHQAWWRCLTAIGRNFDTGDPTPAFRHWVLPFYFRGRTRAGEEYVAFFPVAGTIRDFFMLDHTRFLLWPLYVTSGNGPVESTTSLWPLISWAEGDGTERFRVVPFYGRSSQEGEYESTFILWPFWTSRRFLSPASGGRAFVLFPFYGQVNRETEQTRLFLPPLIRFTRSERQELTYCPWPFYQRMSGDIDKLYYWPLWGRKDMPGVKSRFVLWPLFRWVTIDRGDTESRHFIQWPFVRHEADRAQEAGSDEEEEEGVSRRYLKLWPLALYQRDGDRVRYRMPDLWPRKYVGPLERNFAPLWTLYDYRRHGEGTETEALWGVYRSSRRKDGSRTISLFPFFSSSRRTGAVDERKWSLFHGLVGFRRTGTQKRWRLLYFFEFESKESRP